MKKLAIATALLMPVQAFAQAGPVGSGRFVIVHSPHVQRDTVLLDTATGKTWQLQSAAFREGEPEVWEPMTRMDNAAEVAELNRYNPPKPQPPK
ncbi:MAG TPA: hypothetical protein VF489_09065 [Sphingobium sp.]|uniref:hypothetical protein n=1 Tax=Sphingobium sp. TaxID=1912891 RepID=UPI002ED4EB57